MLKIDYFFKKEDALFPLARNQIIYHGIANMKTTDYA